jgi:N-acetylmuramoyl-L-alanine amidase
MSPLLKSCLFALLVFWGARAHAGCDRKAFKIAIDIGHTLAHPGARSARGVDEYLFNRTLGARLRALLELRGFPQAFLINADGADVALADRTERARASGADVLVSIHHDSVQERYLSAWRYAGAEQRYCDRFAGYSLFVSYENPARDASVALAQAVGRELQHNAFARSLHHAEEIPGEGRPLLDRALGIYRFDELIVLKTAAMPALLVESGVIVNRNEEVLLGNPAYQHAFVRALAHGLETYCDVRARPATLSKS